MPRKHPNQTEDLNYVQMKAKKETCKKRRKIRTRRFPASKCSNFRVEAIELGKT